MWEPPSVRVLTLPQGGSPAPRVGAPFSKGSECAPRRKSYLCFFSPGLAFVVILKIFVFVIL